MKPIVVAVLVAVCLNYSGTIAQSRSDADVDYNSNVVSADHFSILNNCECTCSCEDSDVPASCNIDFYILLDAASCVRNSWKTMIKRSQRLVSRVDDKFGIGNHARFSIMRFARGFTLDVGLEEHHSQSHEGIDDALESLHWLNEGSYLDEGLKGLNKVLDEKLQDNPGHIPVVLLMTNGISHPDAVVSASDINQLSRRVKGNFYVNTLVPFDQKKGETCVECVYNEKIFQVGGNGGLVKKQIIPRDELDKRSKIILPQLCPKHAPTEKCNDCTCTCDVPAGPEGPEGPRGHGGDPGNPGPPGPPGSPAKDGYCGVPGPNGPDGCEGQHGNPGSHGQPGMRGINGENGPQGLDGRRGAPGRPGTTGNKRGVPGLPGPQGPQGLPAQHGAKGPNGKNGKAGCMGVQGAPGSPGMPGEPGQDGTPGNPGKKGEPGKPGIDGFGEEGPQGPRGYKGFKGPNGWCGRRGAQGPHGRHGSVGEPGPRGVKGMPGPTGPRGSVTLPGGEEAVIRKIRQAVGPIIDKLLPDPNKRTICGATPNCQSMSDYFRDVISQLKPLNLDINTPYEPSVNEVVVPDPKPPTETPYTVKPETDRPYTDRPYTARPDTDRPYTERTYTDAEPTDTERPYTPTPSNQPETVTYDEYEATSPVEKGDKTTYDYTERLPETNQPEHHTGTPMDLVFLIETSDYMMTLEWELVTAWVKRVIEVAKSDPMKHVQDVIVVVRFEQRRMTMQQMLQDRMAQMQNALESTNSIATYLADDHIDALEYANTALYKNLRSDSEKVLIMVTDGMYRSDIFKLPAAEQAAAAAVTLDTMEKYPVRICIGLGSDVTEKEMRHYASAPSKVFMVDTFSEEDLDEVSLIVVQQLETHDELH